MRRNNNTAPKIAKISVYRRQRLGMTIRAIRKLFDIPAKEIVNAAGLMGTCHGAPINRIESGIGVDALRQQRVLKYLQGKIGRDWIQVFQLANRAIELVNKHGSGLGLIKL